MLYQNPQITKARTIQQYKYTLYYIGILSMLVVISEAIRVLFINPNPDIIILSSCVGISHNKKFNQWLAGYIDGNGYFSYSKKGYVSLEITTSVRDKRTQYFIKQAFGGSVKAVSGTTHLRYRLHHKTGLINQINNINGEVRNPIRLLQFKRLCDKYNIDIIQPQPLTYENGWQSGFIDADGSIYYDQNSSQLFITCCNNNKCLLDPLIPLHGGEIYFTNTSGRSFKWAVYKKSDILKQIEYFIQSPLHSAKLHRLKLIPKYYELRKMKAHLKSLNTFEGKLWAEFINKWESFS